MLATGSFMLNEEFACDWQKALEGKPANVFPPRYQQWKGSAGREKDAMPLKFVCGDITRMRVDAISMQPTGRCWAGAA